ncbi:MAG TPA: hypothetical protein VKA48_12140 [Gammaproteobacteria bacterium]|nr:hypothetical protein [Gammaproteobacteria bacterium]
MTTSRHPTRQDVVFAATHAVMHELGWSLADLAESIAVIYCDQVPEEHRDLKLTAEPKGQGVDAYYHWKESTRRQVERLLNGSVRMPVELEEAWIDALPSPYRERVIGQLAARLGYLAVAIPEDSDCTVESLGEVLKEHSEAVQASAPMVADGQITEDDRIHAGEAYREHLEAAASHLGHAKLIERKFPEEVCGGVVRFPAKKAG